MASPDREDRIRERAHALWNNEGQPSGAEERHWLQAAAEIDQEDSGKAKKATTKRVVTAKKAAPKAAAAPVAKKAPAAKPAAKKK